MANGRQRSIIGEQSFSKGGRHTSMMMMRRASGRLDERQARRLSQHVQQSSADKETLGWGRSVMVGTTALAMFMARGANLTIVLAIGPVFWLRVVITTAIRKNE